MNSVRNEKIMAEAAVWLARLRADDRSNEDVRAFQDWLSENPEHVAAFEAVNGTWEATGALEVQSYVLGAGDGGTRIARRALVAGLGILAVGGATAVLLRPAAARVYETDVGEQKHVSLDDNSTAFLDTDTKILVAITAAGRRLRLERGQIYLCVQPERARPFVVTAGATEVHTAQASLDMRCGSGTVAVTLLHGAATVTEGARPVSLHPGDRLIAEMDGQMAMDRPNLADLEAWRSGKMVFDNDTLGQAIAQMNRYSTIKIVPEDPQVGALRISGVYRTGDNLAFAHAVTKLMPLEIRLADRKIVLARRMKR